ncbi:MAG: polysaccharide deacetylase family protein [Candidatus Daviesbacteria bacterium]|nr:polysaccharide deacetylase family protein [Candidatus Daviesbacteria bacterium]
MLNKYIFISFIHSVNLSLKGGLDRPILTLTFDDASRTQFINGWPIMQKYGLLGTFYITTDRLDGIRGMLPEEVTVLYKAGNHIGSHSVSHPNLADISSHKIYDEISQSQRYLQKLLDIPIRDFALPYGIYNNSVLSQIKKNYRSNRTTQVGYNTKWNLNLHKIRTMTIVDNTSVIEIVDWINKAKKNNYWLVFLYHNIEKNPNKWGISPEKFDKQLSVIKNSGIPIVTLDQAITEIIPK